VTAGGNRRRVGAVRSEVEIKDLGHVGLYVRDLDRSVAFYEGVLGFHRIDTGGIRFPAAAFVSASGRTHHELLLIEVGPDAAAQPPGRRVGLYHVGLKVGDSDDELRQVMAHIQDAGVTVVGTSDHTVSHSLYILDPDGNELELYVDVPGVDWKSDPALALAPIKPLRL
jgi:catechol 2,3-dioxygenase